MGAAPSSGVARHLALFAAVECRVVEEGADFTVPLGPLEVLVRLGSWRRLRALLFSPEQRGVNHVTNLPTTICPCAASTLTFLPRFGGHHWTGLNIGIKIAYCFWVKLPCDRKKKTHTHVCSQPRRRHTHLTCLALIHKIVF